MFYKTFELYNKYAAAAAGASGVFHRQHIETLSNKTALFYVFVHLGQLFMLAPNRSQGINNIDFP